jgi:flagellin
MAIINTNIGAINAQASLSRVNNTMETSMERLSTGMRINSAKDDSAGMAIAEKMTSQIMGLNQAVRNANDGKNLLDTTEGAQVEVSSMLQRLRELAVQSSNDTNTASDRGNIAAEGSQLITEVNRVATDTTFNGMKILDGSFTGKQLQIGADTGQSIEVNVDSVHSTEIGAHTFSTSIKSNADATDNGIAAENISVTGHTGTETIAVAANASAKDLAAAVNKVSASTGVDASAETNAEISLSAAGNVSFAVNGTDIGTVAVTDATDLTGLRDAINNKSGTTGVTAKMGDDNSSIILTDKTGDDISISGFEDQQTTPASAMTVTALERDGTSDNASQTLLADGSAGDATVAGQVEFTSMKTFSVSGENGGADVDFLDADSNTSTLEKVSDIDLTTAEGASKAIKVLDVALSKVSQSRSDLGAVSNRLDSTISNLTNITTNVEAARSQIQDADFAKESSDLARGKILSQAATSMLAQANASNQNVLSLLRG